MKQLEDLENEVGVLREELTVSPLRSLNLGASII